MSAATRVSGHARRFEASRVGWLVWCVCGWTPGGPVSTKRAGEVAYRLHRDASPALCGDCQAALTGDRRTHLCKACRLARTKAWAEAHPVEWERHRRRSWLKQKYGITPERYDAILAAQGGRCAVCKALPADARGYRMHVDHDHQTGVVRGILCGPCNRGIGALGDDPDRLDAAASYLRRAA